jgi:hypothetical protein
LFDKEGAHRRLTPEFYLSIRADADTEALPGNQLYDWERGLYNLRLP